MGTMSIQAQNCNCKENYEWTKKTLKKMMGYRHILDTKGRTAYDLHNKITNDKVTNITDFTSAKLLWKNGLNFSAPIISDLH